MANRETHEIVGIGFGVAMAFLSARAQGRSPSTWELLGGGLGGLAGSRGPDALEPAIHPHHRQFAHSVTLLVGGGTGAFVVGRKAQEALARAAEVESDPVARILMQIGSGMSVGAPSGYASHLLADARTPRGIPLLGRLEGDK